MFHALVNQTLFPFLNVFEFLVPTFNHLSRHFCLLSVPSGNSASVLRMEGGRGGMREAEGPSTCPYIVWSSLSVLHRFQALPSHPRPQGFLARAVCTRCTRIACTFSAEVSRIVQQDIMFPTRPHVTHTPILRR